MKYKVCILAAGVGKRMRPLTDHINKALLPVGYKAAISHIIEKFSKDIEIVIAVGYEKEKVKQYLDCVHSDRRIQIVGVDKITEKGSGPGYSLFCCREHLNLPFIFVSVDTLVAEEVPRPDENWMGVSRVSETKQYCTVAIENGAIVRLDDKIDCDNEMAFIGLAGIHDYGPFFDNLENDVMLVEGERQVSSGFSALIEKSLNPIEFSWQDIGSIEGYNIANSAALNNEMFDFSKTDEYLYFVENRVVKYFSDNDIVENRYRRANDLRGLCPVIEFKTDYFYSYKKIKGNIFYDCDDLEYVNRLLEWLDRSLWVDIELHGSEEKEFKDACYSFYLMKTKDRLSKYYDKYDVVDGRSVINGVTVPSVDSMLSEVDWELLCHGVSTKIHGDLQFDNILLSDSGDFVLLDWRQDFSGIIEYGDKYYDLAKMNGGLYVSYKKIKEGFFSYIEEHDGVLIESETVSFLEDTKHIFDAFVVERGLDLKRIEILTGIIFLNMSPMHHAPFSHFIYNLGKIKLNAALYMK